jgi:hypothetical protein
MTERKSSKYIRLFVMLVIGFAVGNALAEFLRMLFR